MVTINTGFIEMYESICRGSEITPKEGSLIILEHLSKEEDCETCECGSTDICSRWKHKDKMCVKCCECDDCIALGEDMYGEWTCDDCGCRIDEDNQCPDEDLPFCEECYHDLEECEDCTRQFKESDGMFNDDNEFRCYDCHEKQKKKQKKKVHPVALLIKDTKPYDIVNGNKNKLFREFCEEQNLYLWGQFLKDTPYSLGEATLAGWGSTDDFAVARGEYEYTK